MRNHLLYHSHHTVDFSISYGASEVDSEGKYEESILLRRRKLLRWNGGARYALLDGKPSPAFVHRSLADEEAAAKAAVQSRKLLAEVFKIQASKHDNDAKTEVVEAEEAAGEATAGIMEASPSPTERSTALSLVRENVDAGAAEPTVWLQYDFLRDGRTAGQKSSGSELGGSDSLLLRLGYDIRPIAATMGADQTLAYVAKRIFSHHGFFSKFEQEKAGRSRPFRLGRRTKTCGVPRLCSTSGSPW